MKDSEVLAGYRKAYRQGGKDLADLFLRSIPWKQRRRLQRQLLIATVSLGEEPALTEILPDPSGPISAETLHRFGISS